MKKNGYLQVSALLLTLCIGCTASHDDEYYLHRGMKYISDPNQLMKLISDPHQLLQAFLMVLVAMTLLLLFFGGFEVWWALINGLRYTGALAAVGAPLYFQMVHLRNASIALGSTGAIAFVLGSILVWETKKRH